MFINIITPCIRPQNLITISRTINFPRENYRWLVVFDLDEFPSQELIPENCESYCHKDPASISGNAQRNFALSLVKDGYIYFNDDDTTVHPELWENIKDQNADFISFDQLWNIPPSFPMRLKGDTIKVCAVDSHNYLVHSKNVGDTTFILDLYEADGYFAESCYEKSREKIYIPKGLSVFNTLDTTRTYYYL